MAAGCYICALGADGSFVPDKRAVRVVIHEDEEIRLGEDFRSSTQTMTCLMVVCYHCARKLEASVRATVAQVIEEGRK